MRTQGNSASEGALVLLLAALAPAICSGGILDPWQWARSDRIEVNIPWLPCEYNTLLIMVLRLLFHADNGSSLSSLCVEINFLSIRYRYTFKK